MKVKNKITELEKLNLAKKWQIVDSELPNFLGYIRADPTLFAYHYFNDDKGNQFKARSYQDIILNDQSKRIVVCISRQMGKTTMSAIKAIYTAMFNPGTTVIVISRTKPQSAEIVRRIKTLMRTGRYTDFKEFFPSQKESQTEIVLKLKGGKQSRILCVPATDAARGYTANMVIVDEAAFIENGDYIFEQVIEPMTMETDGSIMLLSTPNGRRGFFYESFKNKHWNSYQFDYRANPNNTELKMEIKRSSMTRLAFMSEYEAKFITSKSAYFNVNEIGRAFSSLAGQGATTQNPLSVGVDFGKIHDKCVIMIGTIINPNDTPDKHIIRLLERRVKPLGTNYAQIIGELRFIAKTLKPSIMVLDATGVGESPADILAQESGMIVEPIKFTIQSKIDIFSNLKVLFEQGRMQIPNETELKNQLEMFEYEYTLLGNMKLHAPEREHDDECDALALMTWGLTRGRNPPVTMEII